MVELDLLVGGHFACYLTVDKWQHLQIGSYWPDAKQKEKNKLIQSDNQDEDIQ